MREGDHLLASDRATVVGQCNVGYLRKGQEGET